MGDQLKRVTRTQRLKALQRYLAKVAISASTLRNQGASGVVDAAREFLATLDLLTLRRLRPGRFAGWLEKRTRALMTAFPKGAQDNWGAARKALNIFLWQALLNRELAAAYALRRLQWVLETPLDSRVAGRLRDCPGGKQLPSWPGVGDLEAEVSCPYQCFALAVAKASHIPRVYLDALLWAPPDGEA